jgi:hypothetical protein
MAAEFKILVGADLDAAVKSINDFVKTTKNGFGNIDAAVLGSINEFKKLQSLLNKSEDPKAIAIYQKQLQSLAATLSSQIPPAAAKTAASLNNVNKAVANANPTLTNFGRVIQDAPFGILGIANNIDPLISSFQSLKASTGSTGGALKSLFAGLAGPAGIAIGVSAVTSALIAFGPQISKAISGVSEFDQTLRDSAAEGAKSFANASESFGNFVRIVNDSEASVTRQNDALKQANSALGAYGLEIGSISELQKQGSAIGAIYAQIKQEEAKSSILAAKAAEEYAKGVALSIAVEQQDVLGAASALSIGDLIKTLFGGATAAVTFAEGIGNAYKKAADNENLYKKENEKTKLGIDNLIKSLGQVPGVVEKTDKARAASVAGIKAKNIEVQKEISFEDQLLARVKAREAAEKSAQAIAGLDSLRANSATLAGEPQTASLNIGNLTTKLNAQTAALAANSEAYVKNANDIKSTAIATQNAAIAADVLSGVFSGAFQALSQGESPIQAITQSLKQLIVRLAAAAATAAVLSLILGGITGGAPVIAGAASNSFGGIFKSLLGLASGGIASRPTPALIGDGGAEAVIPLSQLANIIGGVAMQMGGGSGGGLSIVRGQDIYYSNNNASRSFGRLFG